MMIKPAYYFITIFLILSGCSKPEHLYKIRGEIFGTSWSVQISTNDEIDTEELQGVLERRLRSIDNIMSTWKDDSELSLFNQYLGGDWYSVSADLGSLIRRAHKIHKITMGAFDPTVEPLIRLWGFNSNRHTEKTPDPVAIDVAKSRIGMDFIEVSDDNTKIRKSKNLSLNLSAIAKGYAVDQLAVILHNQTITNFLVEIGGELQIQGNKKGTPWVIGIETPEPGQRSIYSRIKASNIAMATSGNYRNFFEKDGGRYSHIIDPRTGYPVKHRLASVTVLAQDCTTADAYATAFMVLGPTVALELADQLGLAVYMLVADGDGFKSVSSDSFETYLLDNGDVY